MVRKNKKRKASKARRLHRTLGVGAALFVVFMVLSGLVINHSNGLGLDQRHVSHSFLLGWYGLGGPDNIESFAVGNDWLSFAGSQIYLNEKFVASTSGGIGAVTTGELVIAAASDEILLLDHDGNVVERLPWRFDSLRTDRVCWSAREFDCCSAISRPDLAGRCRAAELAARHRSQHKPALVACRTFT